MSDDNISFLPSSKVSRLSHPAVGAFGAKKGDPDWLSAANSVSDDFKADQDRPAVLDDSISGDLAERLLGTSKETPIKMEDIDNMKQIAEQLPPASPRERRQFEELDPQRLVPFITALVVACLIFATSALFSFPTIAATAALMLPVWPFLAWIVPGFVEAFIVFFGIDTIIWQARAANDRKYSAGQRKNAQKMSDSALWWQVAFTMVAVIANGAHTFLGYEATGGLGTWQAWLGIALASLAPLSVVLITKRASRLIFIYAVKE